MSPEIVGAGFGRTGTLSLKNALEQLGFAPCYHMSEAFANPEHAAVWHEAARGRPPNWHDFLDAYAAVTDWPACYFWRELADAAPDSKVVLTERDPKAWYRSMSKTIFDLLGRFEQLPEFERSPQLDMAAYIVAERTFGGRMDAEHAISIYEAHNEAVKRAIPSDRLLVFDVAEGWAPLCAFLDVPVPSTPFPRTNSTEEFRARAPHESTSGA